MYSTLVYSPLTRPELVFGINKDGMLVFVMFLAIFMILKFFLNFTMLWLLPVGGFVYLVLFISAKVDPFYFSVQKQKSRSRTKLFVKNKGNSYVS